MSSLLSYYLKRGFSRDFPALVAMKIRNARRRRKLAFIRSLPPLRVPESTLENVSIHLLTSRHEYREAMWAVRSLLSQLGRGLPVVFHDDGSIRPENIADIHAALPGAKIQSRKDADAVAEKVLADFPECLRLRREIVLGVKLIDPWLTGTDDVIILDSDVLWFSKSPELENWLAGPRTTNRWNRDLASAYNVDVHRVEQELQVRIEPAINAGLGFLARKSMDFHALENFLATQCPDYRNWLIEQTAYAYLSSRHGVELLPPSYALGTPAGNPAPATLVAKHYVGMIRNDFYEEGVEELTRRWKNLR